MFQLCTIVNCLEWSVFRFQFDLFYPCLRASAERRPPGPTMLAGSCSVRRTADLAFNSASGSEGPAFNPDLWPQPGSARGRLSQTHPGGSGRGRWGRYPRDSAAALIYISSSVIKHNHPRLTRLADQVRLGYIRLDLLNHLLALSLLHHCYGTILDNSKRTTGKAKGQQLLL